MATTDHFGMDKRIRHRYDADGMMETLTGVGLLLVGALAVLQGKPSMLVILVPALLFFCGPLWRKRITTPRIGLPTAEEEQEDKRRLKWVKILFYVVPFSIIAFVAVTDLLLGQTDALKHFLKQPEGKFVLGGALTMLLFAIAAIRRANHFYWIALLALVLTFVAYQLDLRMAVPTAMIGALLAVTGLVRVRKFLSDRPVNVSSTLPPPDLTIVEEKVIRQQTQGGILEFMAGLMMVWLLIITAAGQNMWVMTITGVALLAIMMLGFWIWKRRTIYPRLGYASLDKGSVTQRRTFVRAMCLIAIASFVSLKISHEMVRAHFAGIQDHTVQAYGLMSSLFFGIYFLAVGIERKSVNDLIVGAILLVLPATAMYEGMNEAYAYLLIALVAFTLGAVKMRRFLRDNPVITGDENAIE